MARQRITLMRTASAIIGACIYFQNVLAAAPHPYGEFIGDVEAKWLVENGQDRRMELLHEFSYIDTSGKRWTAPNGWIIDGASIPRFLWTLVGSPFTGSYRRASVIHDYY